VQAGADIHFDSPDFGFAFCRNNIFTKLLFNHAQLKEINSLKDVTGR
jgi:hypothetical protein